MCNVYFFWSSLIHYTTYNIVLRIEKIKNKLTRDNFTSTCEARNFVENNIFTNLKIALYEFIIKLVKSFVTLNPSKSTTEQILFINVFF